MTKPLKVTNSQIRSIPDLFVETIHLTPYKIDNIGDMNPFCRFARTVDDERIVFMPVASGLLPHQDPQKPAYLTVPFPPYVFDLTPGILGPLEGFSETGCKTFAGIGFDEARHITWRVCCQQTSSSWSSLIYLSV